MLAKALAHYFEAKLLLLDITDFSLKVKILNFISVFVGFSSLESRTNTCVWFRFRANMGLLSRNLYESLKRCHFYLVFVHEIKFMIPFVVLGF